MFNTDVMKGEPCTIGFRFYAFGNSIVHIFKNKLVLPGIQSLSFSCSFSKYVPAPTLLYGGSRWRVGWCGL